MPRDENTWGPSLRARLAAEILNLSIRVVARFKARAVAYGAIAWSGEWFPIAIAVETACIVPVTEPDPATTRRTG